MSEERRDLQPYRKPDLPARLVDQVFDFHVQLRVAATGVAIEIKDISPRITQALLDELKERLKESGW